MRRASDDSLIVPRRLLQDRRLAATTTRALAIGCDHDPASPGMAACRDIEPEPWDSLFIAPRQIPEDGTKPGSRFMPASCVGGREGHK